MGYIWENPAWPRFTFDEARISQAYGEYQYRHGAVDLAFSFMDQSSQKRIELDAIAIEAVKSGEIEGESIPYDSVLSSIARRLDIALEIQAKDDEYARNVSQLMVDATKNIEIPMTKERLLLWHTLLFKTVPTGFAPRHIGAWRNTPVHVMKNRQYGEGEVVYEGIPFSQIDSAMDRLLAWINEDNEVRLLIKSAIASLWFVTIHPFDDGNGRISRALADYILAKGARSKFKYFSLSKRILEERLEYYRNLQTITGQDGNVDITDWLLWYIHMGIHALDQTLESFSAVIRHRQLVRTLNPSEFNARQIAMLMRMAEGDFKGKLTREKWMKVTKSTAATAIRDINSLVERHFLIRSEEGGRSTSYTLNTEFLEQMEEQT